MSDFPLVLINPPDPPGHRAVREGAGGMGALAPAESFAYPPHTLATAAAMLRSTGLEFTLLDAVAERWTAGEMLARVPSTAVAAVQASYATRDADAAFLAHLRAERPPSAGGVRTLLIGPAANATWLADGLAQAVLAGEPELALPAAVQAVAGGAQGLLTPAGLGVPGYDEHGCIVDLDTLPFPAWEHVPWPAYRFLSLFSSRGCPDGCRYCPYVLGWGDRFRACSTGRVLDEMRWLAERFAPPRVVFRDPVFARERERVLALCAGIRQAGLSVAWECESRPEHFDRELLREMRAAGCTAIKIGVENADPELLVAVGRVANADRVKRYLRQVIEVARAAVAVGLICRVFVMAGLPGESEASVRRTAHFLRNLPRGVRVHVKSFVWYPGLALSPGQGVQQDWLAALQGAADARDSLWIRLWEQVR